MNAFEALAAAPMFHAAAPAALRSLGESGERKRWPAQTVIFHRGDAATEVCLLLGGRLEISRPTSRGKPRYLASLGAPRLFGEIGVLGEFPRTATVCAKEDATGWSFPAADFIRFVCGEPAVARALLAELARQIESRAGIVEDFLSLDLKGRVAKRLLDGLAGGRDPWTPTGITQAALGDLAGGSREEVSRIMAEFRRRGFVEREGRGYRIVDAAALSKLAGA